jgi:hypothetical protein
LREAGIDASFLGRFEATQEYCDQAALLIARRYLEGHTSWLAADAAINHLYPVMLECPAIPEFAWGVYEAFDAGEYHPDSPTLSDDEVTKPILLAQVGSWRA